MLPQFKELIIRQLMTVIFTRFKQIATQATAQIAVTKEAVGLSTVHYYRVDQLKLHLMFNINHRIAPSYLFCPRVRDQHSIGTRSREYDVVVPRVRGPGSSTFAFTAAKLWNDLPDNIQSIDTPGSFRRAVYMFLVRNYEAYDANPFLYR